jgi:predicted nucleic acid-binding protein
MKQIKDRVFLDANVLFSAAYGSPGLQKLWDLAAKGLCQLCSSAYAIEEARLNLDQQEHLARLEELLAWVTILPEADPETPCPVSLSPKDRPVLLAAIQAATTHLVTGDLRHFGAYLGQVISGVAICTPRDYLSRHHLD